MPRLRQLHSGTPLGVEQALFGEPRSREGARFRDASPDGPNNERVRREVLVECEGRAQRLEPAVRELRAIVAAHEPVELLSSVASTSSMHVGSRHDDLDDAADSVTWPAQIEYLAGLALAVEPGTGQTPTKITNRIVDLLGVVFDALQSQHLIDAFTKPPTGVSGLDSALFTLGLEHLVDRMPGYPTHLEQVDAEIFDRHRPTYLEAIGFNPGDVVRSVRRIVLAQNEQAGAALREIRKSKLADERRQAVLQLIAALTLTRKWTPDLMARCASIDVSEAAAMLEFFATTFGAQPDFVLPTDPNLIRDFPCIRLAEDQYFIPDPWQLIDAVHRRLTDRTTTPPNLVEKYFKHRQGGHQRLVAATLRQVFGDALVVEQQHYILAGGQPGEIDVLVRTPAPIVLEAKAHRVKEAGRRAAPDTVRRLAKDMVGGAIDQLDRSRQYIVDEAGRAFAPRQGGATSTLLPTTVAEPVRIIVTFERVDPLAAEGGALVDRPKQPVWTVSISDLLMVTSVLPDPAQFHHYARCRAKVATTGIRVAMESDALSGYLLDRLGPVVAESEENPDAVVMLGYSSGPINNYFTASETGHPVRMPETGVPNEVLAALAGKAIQHAAWHLAVDAAMASPRATWKRWKSFYRRHNVGGSFTLREDVRLTIGPDAGIDVDRRGAIVLVVGPRRNQPRPEAKVPGFRS